MNKIYTHRLVPRIVDPRTGIMSDAFARFLDTLVEASNKSHTQTVNKAGGLPFATYSPRTRSSLMCASYTAMAVSLRSASYHHTRRAARTASYGKPCRSLRVARYT